MLRRFVTILGGDPNKREIEKHSDLVDFVNELEPEFEKLSDEALRAKTDDFRKRLAEDETLDDLLPEAFAAVREASKRTIGLRHFDVQLIGGNALHQGKIAEMRTGEGKTLVATLPLYLNALTGKGVHLVTVNDYLARRDARWMAPIYSALGMTVGVLQMATRTENGKKAFIVDLERESPHEDQNQLRMVPRQEAYDADIIYGTNSEFGFDYLRDNMTMSVDDRVQRDHYYAIVDEVDNVLIDEARTPLIISGPAQDEAEWYIRMAQVVKNLRPEDYEASEKDRTVTLSDLGQAHVNEILSEDIYPDTPELTTPYQDRMQGYLEQALRAQYLFRRNKDYLVQAGKVVIIDEFTGRLMPGRRWSDGLHQAVEAKEGVRVQSESVTYATITIQNYFRMYEKLAGMTGTALTEAEEFDKIYKLNVLAIPTNLEYQAMRPESGLVELEERDEQGYKYHFYAHRNDPQHKPVYWKRKDFPDVVYRTEESKLRAITREMLHDHVIGRPLLVGTTSVELSERVSNRLKAEPLRRLAQVLLLRQAWLEKNNREEDGRQIPELQFLNGPLEQLDISNMRKMARDLGISFNPEDVSNLDRLLQLMELSASDSPRLIADLQAGIPHQVLNARKHTEESQIIAGAGAFGAVTIATNMAGRGVDIKLGGDLAEEILSAVNRVLSRNGYSDPYEMTLEERRQALQMLTPADYGVYDTEVNFFLKFLDDMERVRAIGGLHVIGSERHEARRIDNQLRGRSARQGDPGSSRFYLSMEDELMRLFGGQQADNLMQRLKIDDAMPLEVGLVSRIVEQSQTRVEGANFDVRKHLLEYDDVLNTQRTKIYGQRDLIFTKDDLSEDVTEMLRTEVLQRVPEALKDEEGPWTLLAWLEQVQPPLNIGGVIFPSYPLRLLVDRILPEGEPGTITTISRAKTLDALQELAENALNAEEEHVLHAVNTLLNQSEDRLDEQLKERLEAVDTFFEGLSLEDETDTRRPVELVNDLTSTLRLPIKLTPEQQRLLREDPGEVQDEVSDQVESMLSTQAVVRLVGAVERRLEEPLELNASQLAEEDWQVLADRIISATQATFARRRERYLGPGGQITKDLENALARIEVPLARMHLLGLMMMIPQGARATFDKKTHRRVWQRTNRLTYVFAAARLIDNIDPDDIADDALDHLEQAQAVMRQAWGQVEFLRLANSSLSDLDDQTRRGLEAVLGGELSLRVASQPLLTVTGSNRDKVVDELGRRALTEIYRQLMLGVVTELWVDYLTQMEALRVAIGLEAYAQRDPLVQYKSRAFGLFQDLLSNMRLGVVTRMFTYRPRDLGSVQASTRLETPQIEMRPEAAEPEESLETGPEVVEEEVAEPVAVDAQKPTQPSARNNQDSASKKRRRRRH
jgi:preprotein translocase subunit SecA